MAANILLTPAKKKTSFSKEYPFPIYNPDDQENWNCFIGNLSLNCVLVEDDRSIKLLYSMGFFGKGSLSKYAPKICCPNQHSNKKRKNSQSSEDESYDIKRLNKDDDDITMNKDDDITMNKDDDDIAMNKDDDDIIIDDELEDKIIHKYKNTEINEEDKHNDKISVHDKCQNKANETCIEIDDGSIDIEIDVTDIPSTSTANNATFANIVQAEEKENLQLTFEEAFFLSYALGCLVVKENGQYLNLLRLWTKLCNLSPNGNFPVRYVAYHHFRSKGWIVKSGLNYGADYILYKEGPPFYHSTYSVIIKSVKEKYLKDAKPKSREPFTWQSFSALNRINNAAGKGIILLYVIKPDAMSENKISTPFCIKHYKVQEVLVKRWVPSEGRMEDLEKT